MPQHLTLPKFLCCPLNSIAYVLAAGQFIISIGQISFVVLIATAPEVLQAGSIPSLGIVLLITICIIALIAIPLSGMLVLSMLQMILSLSLITLIGTIGILSICSMLLVLDAVLLAYISNKSHGAWLGLLTFLLILMLLWQLVFVVVAYRNHRWIKKIRNSVQSSSRGARIDSASVIIYTTPPTETTPGNDLNMDFSYVSPSNIETVQCFWPDGMESRRFSVMQDQLYVPRTDSVDDYPSIYDPSL